MAKVKAAQTSLVEKCVILNEIQKLHFGYGFPLFVYTHAFEIFELVPRHQRELDAIILAINMADSLRRRHVAVSQSIIPRVVDELYEELDRPLVMKNLGSGVGLDALHTAVKADGKLSAVLNYDTDAEALALGQRTTKYLEEDGCLEPGTVQYVPKSLTKSFEPADIIVKIGVICGLQDPIAKMLLASDYSMLNEGGKLIVSSSNEEMRKTDPLGSFLIQHIGTREDPKKRVGPQFQNPGNTVGTADECGLFRD